jgi:long-chain acyl-CoA synthetase
VMTDQGIPLLGSFAETLGLETQHSDALPFGTFNAEGWYVSETINQASLEVVFGNRSVRAFQDRPPTYDAMFRLSVARDPDAEAVVCGSRRFSYRELDDLIERTACGFVTAGLLPGERVAVMLDNRVEFVVAVLGCVRAGGIAVPLGTRLGPSDVAYIVGHAEPAFVVTAEQWLPRFPTDGNLRESFVADAASPGLADFSELAKTTPAPLPTLGPEQTMMIVYTSGTTGKPKGACLTHVNFVHTCLHYLYALAIDRPQRSLLTVPVSHIAGFGPVLSVTLASGGVVVMMREFKARDVLETIARERITYAVLVPAMYQLCALAPTFREHDLSSWSYGIYGGAVMPPAVIDRFTTTLPRLRMINAYGATETCAVCTIMSPTMTLEAPSSVGLPLQCDDILIVDGKGRSVDIGETGEILIRGPNVIPGYWRDPEATEKTFHEGYWRSGDIGSRDAQGRIYVHDRLKDMINRGGFKVFSAEVENALLAHEGVVDCALVGVPDEVLGEKSFAFVQCRDAGSGPDGPALKAYLAARIADYKVPDFWHVSGEPVPRNQNGKLQKDVVRQLAATLLRTEKKEPAGSGRSMEETSAVVRETGRP